MELKEESSSRAKMHILIAKYLSQETNANESVMVEAWIKKHKSNKTYFEQLKRVWDESKKLAPGKRPYAQKALERFRERTAAEPRTAVFRIRWLQIAATVLLAAGVATIIKLREKPHRRPASFLTFRAGSVVQSNRLPDGSVVQLQPHAILRCPAQFVAAQRQVELRGGAYFFVVHDSAHPFQISVNDVKITVLGTSFKISGTAGNTEVDVITGMVRVTKEQRSINVLPHEKLVVPASGSLWIKQSDTVSNARPSPKATQRSSTSRTMTKPADSIVHDYTYHRRVMASIIDDLVKEGLATDRKSIVWAALTDSLLVVNGQTQPETIHQKFMSKYHIVAEDGYYYGPVKISGKGYFFDNRDFIQ